MAGHDQSGKRAQELLMVKQQRSITVSCHLSGGELVERDGKSFKIFYGMSSSTAMKKHAGGVAEYR